MFYRTQMLTTCVKNLNCINICIDNTNYNTPFSHISVPLITIKANQKYHPLLKVIVLREAQRLRVSVHIKISSKKIGDEGEEMFEICRDTIPRFRAINQMSQAIKTGW